jgi:hypothetical protein
MGSETKKATGPGCFPRRWPSVLAVAHLGGARNDDPDDNAYDYEQNTGYPNR